MLSRLITHTRNATEAVKPAVLPPTQLNDQTSKSSGGRNSKTTPRTNPSFLPNTVDVDKEKELEHMLAEMNEKDLDLVQSMYKHQLTWGERPPVLAEDSWINDTMYPPKPSSPHMIATPLSLKKSNIRGEAKKPRGKLTAHELIHVLTTLEGPLQNAEGYDRFLRKNSSKLHNREGVSATKGETQQSNQEELYRDLESRMKSLIGQYSLSSEFMSRPHEGVLIVQDNDKAGSAMDKRIPKSSDENTNENGSETTTQTNQVEPSPEDAQRLKYEADNQMSGYGMTPRLDGPLPTTILQEDKQKVDNSQRLSSTTHVHSLSLTDAAAQLEEENRFLRREKGGQIADHSPFVSNFHLVATQPDEDIGQQSEAARDNANEMRASDRPDLEPNRILFNVIKHLRVPYLYTDPRGSGVMKGPHAVASKSVIPEHILNPIPGQNELNPIQRLGVSNLAAVLNEAKTREREEEVARAEAQRKALVAENARLLELRERQIKHSLMMKGVDPQQAEMEAKQQAEKERAPGSVQAAMANQVKMQTAYEEHLKQQDNANKGVPTPSAPQTESKGEDLKYRPSPAALNAIAKMKREAAMRKAGIVDEQIWGGLPNIPGSKHYELKQASNNGPRIKNLWE